MTDTSDSGPSVEPIPPPNGAQGKNPVAGDTPRAPRWMILALGLYLMIAFLLLVYLLVQIWPKEIADPGGGQGETVWLEDVNLIFLGPFKLSDEARIILIVLVTGSIGGMIHALQSFVGFVGSRSFVRSWLWWYVLRPLVGAGLALFFYLALRGGLMATQAEVSDLSVFGFAAVGALAGMFSEQATAKLKELFDTLFRTKDQRPDKLDQGGNGNG